MLRHTVRITIKRHYKPIKGLDLGLQNEQEPARRSPSTGSATSTRPITACGSVCLPARARQSPTPIHGPKVTRETAVDHSWPDVFIQHIYFVVIDRGIRANVDEYGRSR